MTPDSRGAFDYDEGDSLRAFAADGASASATGQHECLCFWHPQNRSYCSPRFPADHANDGHDELRRERLTAMNRRHSGQGGIFVSQPPRGEEKFRGASAFFNLRPRQTIIGALGATRKSHAEERRKHSHRLLCISAQFTCWRGSIVEFGT